MYDASVRTPTLPVFLLFLVAVCQACATSSPAGAGGAGGEKAGRSRSAALVDDRPLVVAGPRCVGAACRCRAVDARGFSLEEPASASANTAASPEVPIADGMKRFELRTARGSDEVQITVEGRGTLHKPSETIESTCGYVDLPPGEHRVRLRVNAGPGEGGTSPRMLIYEYGDKTHSWYASFGLACNDQGPCTRADMQDRIAELARAHGLFDHCGSVKVTDIHWEADKAPDERVTSLDLELTLKVYKFSPRFPRGGACKGLNAE